MKRKKGPTEDPVVQEVRAIRQRIWKDAGETFQGLLARLDRTVPKKPGRNGIRRRKKPVSRA